MSRYNISLSDKEVDHKISEFRRWINLHPELPQNLESVLLARYLKLFSYRQEKAQRLLVHALDFRRKNPWFFTKRDPESPEFQKLKRTTDMILMHQHTKENHKIVIYQLLTDDASHIVLNDCIKMFLMCVDVRLHLPVASYSEIETGEIIIFDMKNLTLRHLSKCVISTLRMFFRYLQDIHPVRIVQLHVVNCTPVINRAMLLIKPFLHAKLANALKFHNPGCLDALHQSIPRELLPVDYGGDGQSMAELKEYWLDVLDRHRDFVKNDDYFKLNDVENKSFSKERRKKKEDGGMFSFLTS